jgi:hypothetical protein
MKKLPVRSEKAIGHLKTLGAATLATVQGGGGNPTAGSGTPLPHPNV